MFKDRVFNISFLISLAGHLFCIFAFVLVITPKGFTLNRFPEASFLGPILEAGAFQPGYNLRPVAMATPYKEDFAASDALPRANYEPIDKNAVIIEDNFQKAQFIEPVFEKQLPPLELQKDDQG